MWPPVVAIFSSVSRLSFLWQKGVAKHPSSSPSLLVENAIDRTSIQDFCHSKYHTQGTRNVATCGGHILQGYLNCHLFCKRVWPSILLAPRLCQQKMQQIELLYKLRPISILDLCIAFDGLRQGNILRGIVNWSDAARSVVQGPKQSL